jgi:hypothetical protein
MNNLIYLLRRIDSCERGSELTEQIFWIGLVILAVVLLLPQLRTLLVDNLQNVMQALQ